jgi:hypothetical protein
MPNPLRKFHAFVLWFILAFHLPGLAGTRQEEPGSKITVRVYNYAKIPLETLTKAEKQANNIFQRTGVGLNWLDCPTSTDDFQSYPSCQSDPGPTEFILGILPQFKIEDPRLHNTSLGFANLQGSMAQVSYHRIKHLVQFGYAGEAIVLGHAVAHEIGHLLLGSNQHSSEGIMRADWGPKDLKAAADDGLIFTSQQAERIRAAAKRRAMP